MATFNVITHNYAFPVFVDSDLEPMQIDATKIGAAITDNTKLIVPVHIAETPADLDTVGHVAREHNIPFIEDAPAPLAVWRGQPVGTHGLGGCLSFQASKNLTAGEGGAVLTNDEDFANRCYDFQTPGGGRAKASNGRGSNYRMTEFQGSILLTAARLGGPSQTAATKTPGTCRSCWPRSQVSNPPNSTMCGSQAHGTCICSTTTHAFGGRPRATFLKELREAGVSASPGYSALNRSAHVLALANNPHYIKIYGRDFMAGWAERNACPVNDQLCQQAVWFTQTVLLGTRDDMERIAASIDQVRTKA
ncbi:MAG: DegT/DnrJ/EryC1/StrS family aminotransferase [Pirellulaceae bacterium]